MKNILIISGHPDDLEMSCGGAVSKWVREGHRVINLILVPGVPHLEYLESARKHLGYEVVGWPGDRDSLAVTPSLVSDIEAHFGDIKFDRIVTHWKEDWHQDHKLSHELGTILARRQPVELWYMSSHPYHLKYNSFRPDIYVDISDYAPFKYKAMDAYENISQEWSIGVRSHDAWRGTFLGVKRAEVFQAGNIIE